MCVWRYFIGFLRLLMELVSILGYWEFVEVYDVRVLDNGIGVMSNMWCDGVDGIGWMWIGLEN